ncbi:CBS domain-containing protein [Amycolatopsis alkalitolerans]|uniref:CBS domain-containing protein n=1 Tax=Amycolatopsis alkalitolerans TaxID=2547244 RepID=A0A5C4M0R7_9PSEU|nr:CBS domain-containing protein [Amycolatopsis alkalitolerans]TNC24813.1 CBS domain-containing protein [Amycolatopsis alkalitolerans]
MRAADLMSSPVYGITPDASLDEAAGLMMERGFTTLPVITAGGLLLGLVTESDLVRALFTPGTRGEPTPDGGAVAGLRPHAVRQVMRGTPVAVRAEMDVSDVAMAMVDAHERCLPVVDGGERVVGMISWRDLLANLLPG